MTNNVLGRAFRACVLGGFAAGALLAIPSLAAGQEPQGDTSAAKPYKPPPMYDEATLIAFTLTADFGQLRRDRKEETPYRPARISYVGDSGVVSLPVRVRTRGIWRKRNCEIPPLMLNFTKDSTKKTTFTRIDRARLQPHCRDHDDYEQYILQEFQLYRVHRLLTPLSYNVRLARVTFVDEKKKDTVAQRHMFLSETDDTFAERIGAKLIELEGAGPSDLDPYESAMFGVFQYFVANSDFSIRALHNAVLIFRNETYIPVARDFDWSGAVNARYAKPNPVLGGVIRTVRDRLMRGYCAPEAEYQKVFALFREKKDAMYALYSDSLGSLLKPDVAKSTLKYFDDFYATINDPRRAKREIIEACLGGSA
jgi:hypothetical protein